MDVKKKYKLFFKDNDPNKLPIYDTDEFYDLIDWEKDKCLGGIDVDGVHIPGFLYWHTNHWHIFIDEEDKYGNVRRVSHVPELRDNEWIISNAVDKAKNDKKGLVIIGSRQVGKSETEASYLAYNAVLFENSQNTIAGGSAKDINNVKTKVLYGIGKLWEGLFTGMIDKSWSKDKDEVKLGYKSTDNQDVIWSVLQSANTQEGRKTEVIAGSTLKGLVYDEIGKFEFAEAFEAAKPAFVSKFGWRVTPLLFGTGGSFDRGTDAKQFFFNPDANNMLAFDFNGKRTGLFLSGIHRMDCKSEKTLDKYLISTGELKEGNYPNLLKIKISVSDEERAVKKINEERETLKADPNKIKYLKHIMYYPLTVDECFLTQGTSIFNSQLCKDQKLKIEVNQLEGQYLELYRELDGIKWKKSDKVPISTFPTNGNEDKDTPIVIWEHPLHNCPFGLYTAGVDSYRDAESEDSASLGSVYIYKRAYDINDVWSNHIVASYTGRPKNKDEWNENASLLIEYYNARALVENDEYSFIQYMKDRNRTQWLEQQPRDIIKEYIPTSNSKRDYGISRGGPNSAIRDLLDGTLKRYIEETLEDEIGLNGEKKTKLGVTRIFDPMLLEELSVYDGKINTDRRVAAELAIWWGTRLGVMLGVVAKSRPRTVLTSKHKKTNKLFGNSRSVYSNSRKKLFKK